MVALHLVFGQSHDSGIRSICWFLELSQLDTFIAPSYGSQQKVAAQVEQFIGQFGQEEDRRLGQQMPKRNITLCEDETFHLGAHHSPDVFHVQYDVSKATSLALNRQNEKAKEAYELAKVVHEENQSKRKAFEEQWPCLIRDLELEKERLRKEPELDKNLQETRTRLEATSDRMQRARDARCGIAKRLMDLSKSILARARSPDRPFSELPESIQLSLEQKAEQAADVFQRSSSCVEGRNGQLSLRHHGLRELTASKLRALRTIHNYVIRSPDGTTAAERFFANKPRDLFRWLLDQLPMPARPRQKKKNGAT